MMIETGLPRSKPEEQNVRPSAIPGFVQAVEAARLNLHSFMLVRHGKVLAEHWWPPHSPQSPHALFSISKSFCATAVGMLADEGRLSVEDAVLPYFSALLTPEIEQNMGELQIKHLLTMSTGHLEEPTAAMRNAADGNWARAFLQSPIGAPPGTLFVYNSGATYMLSAIVQRVTGQTVVDYLQPKLFEPLGIRNAVWETCPLGISVGGWGLQLTTEDIAKFGQLYLRKGDWEGRRLISEAWIDEAVSPHIATASMDGIDKQQGYGYRFWRCRFDGYCARGANGQFCIVLPERDAVIAVTSDEKNMQAILNVVWEHLLPAIQ